MNEYFEDLRVDYNNSALYKKDLDPNPLVQSQDWLEHAIKRQAAMPNAVSLATTNADEVLVRTVLVKEITDAGFVFFTDYSSHKSAHIIAHAKVGLLFNWLELDRQIKISGACEKISTKESQEYFYTRPKASQIAAYISNQSSSVDSRETLTREYEEACKKFSESKVPFPYWGGYLVTPDVIEFWQGNAGRMHDNIKYTRTHTSWKVERTYP